MRGIGVGLTLNIAVVTDLFFLINDWLPCGTVASSDVCRFMCDQEGDAAWLIVLVADHDCGPRVNDAGHALKRRSWKHV